MGINEMTMNESMICNLNDSETGEYNFNYGKGNDWYEVSLKYVTCEKPNDHIDIQITAYYEPEHICVEYESDRYTIDEFLNNSFCKMTYIL